MHSNYVEPNFGSSSKSNNQGPYTDSYASNQNSKNTNHQKFVSSWKNQYFDHNPMADKQPESPEIVKFDSQEEIRVLNSAGLKKSVNFDKNFEARDSYQDNIRASPNFNKNTKGENDDYNYSENNRQQYKQQLEFEEKDIIMQQNNLQQQDNLDQQQNYNHDEEEEDDDEEEEDINQFANRL